MTTKMKIIIGSVAGFIVVLTTTLILLTGRGIDYNTSFKFVYEDDESLYYYIDAYDKKTVTSTKKFVRFDLEDKEFEVIYDNLDLQYSSNNLYNTPLVYSNAYKDFINITTGEVLSTDYLYVCSTNAITSCNAITDDLVLLKHNVEGTLGFEIYKISTEEVLLDRIETLPDEEYEDIRVSNFHYFPTDNKFLYSVQGVNYRVEGDITYFIYESNDYYLVDLTTGIEEKVSDDMAEYLPTKISTGKVSHSSSDYMYSYDYDTHTINKLDSSLELIHSNDYGYIYDIQRHVSASNNFPLVYNYHGIYEFDEVSDTVKEIYTFVGDVNGGSFSKISISQNYALYSIDAMFLKADYFVLYDIINNEELYRSSNLDFLQ